MRAYLLLLAFALTSLLPVASSAAPASPAESFWPQWRGPMLNGTAPHANPPLTWSQTNNLKWKVAIPGSGTSTPIVWNDKLVLLTAIPLPASAQDTNAPSGRLAHQFVVLCLDRGTGRTVWQQTAIEAIPHEKHHVDHGFASASPVVDGKMLVAYFGSRGLHAYDWAGQRQWSKQFGQMRTRNSFGEGASPALHGGKVFVVWDDEEEADFIAAFDQQTGKELWRTPRNEPTGWTTPLVIDHGGVTQVIVNGSGAVRSYDAETGKELWRCAGQTGNPIPTPVVSSDTVFVMSGFRGAALFALALNGRGDLAGTEAVKWTYPKQTPYVPSPLLAGDLLYFSAANTGVLTCLDARTGTPHFAGEKLEGISGIYASPVSAGDRVYVLGRDGTCVVLRKGPQLEVLARNQIDERADASLALVGGDVFLRGHRHLYCFSESKP